MRRTRVLAVVVGALALPLLVGASSAGAISWQPIETLDLVRGAPNPQVAVYAGGTALVVYSNGEGRARGAEAIRFAGRDPGRAWRDLGTFPTVTGSAPRLATASSGATAVAVADQRGRLVVINYRAPGPAVLGSANPPLTQAATVDSPGLVVGEPAVGIDDAGNATVAWRSTVADSVGVVPVQVKAVTVSATGLVGPVESLGAPADCRPEIDVNGRGDAVVSANCADQPADVYYRPAGGEFGPGEAAFGPDEQAYVTQPHVAVSLDGGGTVHAYEDTVSGGMPGKGPFAGFRYAARPPQGPFGPAVRMPHMDYFDGPLRVEAFEDGRVIAAWGSVQEAVYYAVKPPGGQFGTRQSLPVRGEVTGLALAASRRGPALISWREHPREQQLAPEQPAVAVIEPSGAPEVTRVGIPGFLASPETQALAFAIDDSGRAAGAWEQRCSRGGALALTATALDARTTDAEPPCQDRSAPKVAVRPQRARLVGRRLRVRIGCDEACRMVVRARVLRGGKGRPLATAKTPRGVPIGARRYRTFSLRMTKRQAARVHANVAARQRVSVRLALSVRDGYENGTVRRVAVPLRR